ncbi:zinc-ribbon domain-containing protein [Micromonospora sp. NPDC049559]|uniref:NADase-type glycan-binding domain-containing protein n=1 Tax=Micromonospora sp. NPDC049559 TaxID=3155923 RepID=UPI0034478FD5
MIVCAACGSSNRDNERFCGNCGAFLAWEGTPVARPVADPAPTPTPGPTPTATSAPVEPATGGVTATATDEPSRGEADAGARAGGASGTTVTAADTTTATAADAPPTADPVRTTEPARPGDPVAVQPGMATQPRRPRPVEEVRPAPVVGERICPKCGAGNEKTRRFCSNCGSPLAVQEVVEAKRTWWQRLIDRLRRRNREARQRRDRRAARRLLMIISVICVLTILAVVGPPLVRRGINEIRDQTGEHVPLRPTGAQASSEQPDAPAARIFDGATNRFWAPNGPAAEAWVEVNYADPVRILDIVVTPGVSTEQDKFLAVGRPQALAVVATRANGETVDTVLQLRDQPGPQSFEFEAPDVAKLRLVVRSVYGPPRSNPSVAIGEVEFFGRR